MNSENLILVVDDEPDVLFGTSRILKQAGYLVMEAKTGEEAIQSARKNQPDLILLDVVLPDIDGLEVCRLLKANKATSGIFIIIVSGEKTKSADQSDGLEIGADEYIVRPVGNRELLARVKAMLRLRIAEKKLKKLVEERTNHLHREIEDHEKAKKALRISERKAKSILEAMPDLMFMLSADGTHIDYYAPSIEQLYLKPEEFLEKRVEDVLPQEVSEKYHHHICKALETQQLQVFEYKLDFPEEARYFESRLVFSGEQEVLAIVRNISERKKVEDALRVSGERLKLAQKIAKLGHWFWDIASGRVEWSDQVYEIFKVPQKEVSYEFVKSLVHPEDLSLWYDTIHRAIARKEPFVLDYRIIRPDGIPVWLHNETKTVYNECEELCGYQGTVQDITERKQAEETLRESEAKFKTVAEQTPNMLFINKNGRIVYANDKCKEMMGFEEDEFYSPEFNFLSLMAPESAWQAESSFQMHMKDIEVPTLEYTLIKKDSSRIETLINTKLIDYEGERAILGIVTDITEQKRALEEINQMRERFEMATKGGNVGIWDWDLSTGDMFISPNLKMMLGYDDAEIGNNIEEWGSHVYFEDVESVMKEANGCIEGTKGDYRVEHRMVHKDGSLRWFLASGKVERDKDGLPIRFLGTDTDITKLKNIEETLRQTQKMEALGTLSGGIAHEFNNILGIIIGNTELAIDDVPEWNPAKDCLEEIRTASLCAKDVVRQILSFSRKTPASRKPINISTIIQESLKLIRATIPTNIDIRKEILCESEMILANPTEINQILINLCSNSVHAMEGETGFLKIRLEKVILDDHSRAQYKGLMVGEHVKLTIKDSGHGINPKIKELVFDPYFTTKDVDKGLGMGLAIVYGIVKKHDGAIRVNSKVGKGTTVEVLFPVTVEQTDVTAEELDDMSRGTERILLVDDEPSLVKLVMRILELQGYKVVGKTSSIEALKLFQIEPGNFDLVITDMSMPEMPGDRLAQEIIKTRLSMPVIACTGHSDRMDENRAKESGIKAYTMKPFVKKDFLKTVRKVLDEAKGFA